MKKIMLEQLVSESISLSDISRKIYGNNLCGNRQTIKKYIKLYNININHFVQTTHNRNFLSKRTLSEILVVNSNYDTTNLKNRLYKEGLKERKCEKCGQDENWHGEHISMILDHINGINDDLRIENLRILCPNCNATLPTHGGKNVKHIYKEKIKINKEKKDRNSEKISFAQRKVMRPEYNILIKEINDLGYSATGRKYSVSDNAIRKWIKFYEKYIPS
jgi:hypothetical protein